MNTENKQYRSLAIKKHIESMDDVREFLDDLEREDLLIHPEDSFHDIAEKANISPEMADRLDGTMEDCVRICDREHKDICGLVLCYYRNKVESLQKSKEINKYMIITSQGFTQDAYGDETENCQVLGRIEGLCRYDAVATYYNNHKSYLERAGFEFEDLMAIQLHESEKI